jgi:hypothetical protein
MDLLNYDDDNEDYVTEEKSKIYNKSSEEFFSDQREEDLSTSVEVVRKTKNEDIGKGQVLRSFEETALGASSNARRIASKLFNRQQDESIRRQDAPQESFPSLKRQRDNQSPSMDNQFYIDNQSSSRDNQSSSRDNQSSSRDNQSFRDSSSTTEIHLQSAPFPHNSSLPNPPREFHLDKRMRRELGLEASILDDNLPTARVVSAGQLHGEWRPTFQQAESETAGKNKVFVKTWSHETGTAVITNDVSRAAKSRHQIQSVAAAALAASASLSSEHSNNQKTKAQTYAKYGW